MYYKKKKVKDPIQSTFNDLKLFEQNSYCYKYLKNNNSNIDDSILLEHADIASSSFRQASEYYKSASMSPISTSPLLYSYAMNNLLKGVCYLISFDSDILDGFRGHGFKLENKNLKTDILNSKVTLMKHKGVVHSILKLYGNSLECGQDIYLYKLLRHIPNIDKFYYESVGSISLIATETSDEDGEFIINGSNMDAETNNIFKGCSIVGNILSREKICSCYLTMKTQDYLNDNVFNRNDMFYKNYLNIPEEFNEGLKCINISFYCYLLMMSYGMIVRYNPNIWEKYIDKKDSKYSTLIELSISNAVLNFYFQMHNLLLNFYYYDNNYNELDIKQIIDNSTSSIMNNITKKIKDDNFRGNQYAYLPWKENVR